MSEKTELLIEVLSGGAFAVVCFCALPYLVGPVVSHTVALISVLLTVAVAYLRYSNRRVVAETSSCRAITDALLRLRGLRHESACKVVNDAIEKIAGIERGRVPLSITEYFEKFTWHMEHTKKGDSIHAVSVNDEMRWRADPREVRYLKANKKAAGSDVSIQRVFVVNDSSFLASDGASRLSAIRDQATTQNMHVHLVRLEDIKIDRAELVDAVFFKGHDHCFYWDKQDPGDPTRVATAGVVDCQADVDRFEAAFETLFEGSSSFADVEGRLQTLVELGEENRRRQGESTKSRTPVDPANVP